MDFSSINDKQIYEALCSARKAKSEAELRVWTLQKEYCARYIARLDAISRTPDDRKNEE